MAELSPTDEPKGTSLTRLVRPEPLRLRVQDAIRELIVSRTLLPGQHVAEVELAARWGVSRQPVREALQALHQDAWVDLHVGRGAFVHEPTPTEVNEVFGVRAVLEQEAARLACANITAPDIADLRRLSRTGRQAVLDGDNALAVSTNARLHQRIVQAAGNATLASLLDSLDQRIRWYFTPLVRRRAESSWDEHDRIIDALEKPDEDQAAALMRTHTENTRAAYNASEAEPPVGQKG